MPLPNGAIVQLSPTDKPDRAPFYVVCFRRKDDEKDASGYYSWDYKLMQRLKLRDFDKFKKKPKTWDEVEQFFIEGLLKVSR